MNKEKQLDKKIIKRKSLLRKRKKKNDTLKTNKTTKRKQ